MPRSRTHSATSYALAGVSVPDAAGVYENGRLRIDFDAYEVFLDGQEVRLYLREFELLRFLVQYPNRVFSREQLLESVWGNSISADPRTIDVHVRRLRMQIERDDAHPEIILTVRGVGYKFADRALSAPRKDSVRQHRTDKSVTRL